MRLVSITVSLAALTGCINGNWTTTTTLDGSCTEEATRDFFLDLDGDGWGEPFVTVGTTREVARSARACTPAQAVTELAQTYPDLTITVADNNRDCVDDESLDPRAAEITGRIGSICPDQLVPSDTDIFFTPFSEGGREMIVVHDDSDAATPIVWGDLAADACGPYGWGGGTFAPIAGGNGDEVEAAGSLLTLVGSPGPTLTALRDALSESGVFSSAGNGEWAGYVGVVSYEMAGQAAPGSGESGWWWESWTDEGLTYTKVEDVDATGLGECNGALPDATEYNRLALVRQDTTWCLGLPSDVERAGSVDYESRMGHFVCERQIPNAADWAGTSDWNLGG
ncbi:MAG: hypothetical protein EP330_09770 [Deltaproteobacteria bacterium]|nr:MAG: hypothetical protein EP330_09770 [Deltaproteobacteria bacterium]